MAVQNRRRSMQKRERLIAKVAQDQLDGKLVRTVCLKRLELPLSGQCKPGNWYCLCHKTSSDEQSKSSGITTKQVSEITCTNVKPTGKTTPLQTSSWSQKRSKMDALCTLPNKTQALHATIQKTIGKTVDIIEKPISKITYSNQKPGVTITTKPARITSDVAHLIPNEKLALSTNIQKNVDGMFDIIEKPNSKITYSNQKPRVTITTRSATTMSDVAHTMPNGKQALHRAFWNAIDGVCDNIEKPTAMNICSNNKSKETITLRPVTKTTATQPMSNKKLTLKTMYEKNFDLYSGVMKRKQIPEIVFKEESMLKRSTKTYSRVQKKPQKDVLCPSPPKQVHLETHNKNTLDEDSVVPEDIPALILECTSTESQEIMSCSLSQEEESNCLSPNDRLVLECTSPEPVEMTIESRTANNCSPSQNNCGVVACHLHKSKSLLQCTCSDTLSTGNLQFQKNFEEMNGCLSPNTPTAKNTISEPLGTTAQSLLTNGYSPTSDHMEVQENLPSDEKLILECTTPESEEVTQRQSRCRRSHKDSLSPKEFPRSHNEDTIFHKERSSLEMTNQKVSSNATICSSSQKNVPENENTCDNDEFMVEHKPLELLETIGDVCLSSPRSPGDSECLLPNDGLVFESTKEIKVEISDERPPTVYTWSLKNLEDTEYLVSDGRPVLERPHSKYLDTKTSCSQSHHCPQDYDKCQSRPETMSIKPINTKTLSNKINTHAQKNNNYQVAEISTDGEFIQSPIFNVLWNDLHCVQMPCDSWGFHRIKTSKFRIIAFSQVILSDDSIPITVKHMCIDEKMELVTYILKRRVNFEGISGLSDAANSSCTIQCMVTALRSYREICEGFISPDHASNDDEVIFHVQNALKCFHDVQVTIGKYVSEGK